MACKKMQNLEICAIHTKKKMHKYMCFHKYPKCSFFGKFSLVHTKTRKFFNYPCALSMRKYARMFIKIYRKMKKKTHCKKFSFAKIKPGNMRQKYALKHAKKKLAARKKKCAEYAEMIGNMCCLANIQSIYFLENFSTCT